MRWRRRRPTQEEEEFAALMFRRGFYESTLSQNGLWTAALQAETDEFLALAHVPITYAEATPILTRHLQIMEAALAEGGCDWAIHRPDLQTD